jgi:hypothetical protein
VDGERFDIVFEYATDALQGANFSTIKPNIFSIFNQFLDSVKPEPGKEFDRKNFSIIVQKLMHVDNTTDIWGKNYLGYQRAQIAELAKTILSENGNKPLGGKLDKFTYEDFTYYLEICKRSFMTAYKPKPENDRLAKNTVHKSKDKKTTITFSELADLVTKCYNNKDAQLAAELLEKYKTELNPFQIFSLKSTVEQGEK